MGLLRPRHRECPKITEQGSSWAAVETKAGCCRARVLSPTSSAAVPCCVSLGKSLLFSGSEVLPLYGAKVGQAYLSTLPALGGSM